MLYDIQNNHIPTRVTAIIPDPDTLAMDETIISNKQPLVRPARQKRSPILDARRRRHARLNGRH